MAFDNPLLVIYNDTAAGITNAYGLGDLDLQMKYTLRKEQQGSRVPAIAIGLGKAQLQTQIGAKYALRKSLG